MTGLTYGITGCCVIAIGAALFFLSPDTQSNERVRDLEREPTPLQKQPQNPVPTVADVSGTGQESAREASSTLPPITNEAPLAQQVADLSATVIRLEQTVQKLEDQLSRSVRPLVTGDRTAAGLAGKKAEVDAQAKRSQAAIAELQRFAARFGVVLNDRVLLDPTLVTPLDHQPGFQELRLTATSSLRVLQAVEKRFAADLLDRASFQ